MNISYYISGPEHTPLKYFAKQLGIRHAVTGVGGSKYAPYVNGYDYMPMLQKKRDLADFGMSWDVIEGPTPLEKCKLGLEGRDDEIEMFKKLLENMSLLGIKTVCYNWMPVWGWLRTRTNMELEGGSLVTGFYIDDLKGMTKSPTTFFRKYSRFVHS